MDLELRMADLHCLGCGKKLQLSPNLEIGWRIQCQHCQVFWDVIWLYPLSLERSDNQEPPAQPDVFKQERKIRK